MRPTQIIYRLEETDGSGIYWGYKGIGSDLFEFDDERHPIPEEDSKLWVAYRETDMFVSSFHFGFASVAQLRNWFYKDEYLQALNERGAVIAEYTVECDSVLEGHTQAMFIRGNYPDKVQYNILDYFKLEN